jgi:two-component system copper resistance phosphate regulon response regulator CusR
VKILIVEDEPKAGDYLKQGLREAGYTVDLVTNGVDGLHLGLEGDHDLVILDVMLPGMDGWQVSEQLCAVGGARCQCCFSRPAIRWKTASRGWSWGPTTTWSSRFRLPSCWPRVRTILRRGRTGLEATTLQVADLELDLLRRRVTRSGKRIDLTAKEFGLLELLMRRQGEVLAALVDRLAGVGHELRQRYQCDRGGHAPPASQGGRSL